MNQSRSRLLYNKAIITKLTELINKHPDMRFTQLLWNAGLVEQDIENHIIDNFYEESSETWNKMTKSEFCFPTSKND